ncbi:MAG: tRNA (adenosine(37)-N6)-threonylcarbamoyltransferase complex dimerization subunit type 1 TsaB [Synergistota bacterium]|nr:tRNA (adenosine(37)-N6)-threonylcarbamoyltransferase complex dimerization subunit type 1 TsaB [Synergistota bacterium]
MSEIIVSVDCCTAWTTLGVAIDGMVRGEVNVDARMRQASMLPGLFQSLLDSLAVRVESVSLYSVVTGPGSFTGIKVGISFVTFLAWAGGQMVIPLSSLECTASEGLGLACGTAAVVLQGGGGKIYGALYESEGGNCTLTRLLPERAYIPEEFLEAVSSVMKDGFKDVSWMTDRPEKTARLFPAVERMEQVLPRGSTSVAMALRKKDSAVIPSLIRASFHRDPDTGRAR